MATLPTLFVGHPFRSPFPHEDFRGAVGRACSGLAAPQYADDQFRTAQILDKIEQMIRAADLTLFDISGWNPNVTLELGLAWGVGVDVIMSFNKDIYADDDAPSDLKGIERIDWSSMTELETSLRHVLQQLLSPEGPDAGAHYREAVRLAEEAVLGMLNVGPPGHTINEIARATKIPKDGVAGAISKLLDEGRITKSGERRGTRYYQPAEAAADANGTAVAVAAE